MPYLVRSVRKGRWGKDSGTVPADAVTGDLQTRGNRLSFWYLDALDEARIGDVVLALAAGRERLDTVDVAILPLEEVRGAGIHLEETPGNTPVEELRDLHRDAVGLDLDLLSRLAQLVAQAVHDENRCRRFPRPRVRAILRQAWSDGRFEPSSPRGTLRDELTGTEAHGASARKELRQRVGQGLAGAMARRQIDERCLAGRSAVRDEELQAALKGSGETTLAVLARVCHALDVRLEVVEGDDRRPVDDVSRDT